jgi:hypothetical protein
MWSGVVSLFFEIHLYFTSPLCSIHSTQPTYLSPRVCSSDMFRIYAVTSTCEAMHVGCMHLTCLF